MNNEAIPGWMSTPELKSLAQLAKDCKSWLEIGAWCGRSTFAVVSHLPLNASITVIDPFRDFISFYDAFKPNDKWVRDEFQKVLDWIAINRSDLYVKLIEKKSYRAVPLVDNESIDIAFIDGDHSYNSVVFDYLFCRSKLKPDGIICGHDYTHPEVGQAVDDCSNKEAKPLPDTTIWVHKLKPK